MTDFDQYSNYTFEQLIELPEFRKWVYDSSEELEIFWNQFLRKYPIQQETVLTAVYFLKELKVQTEIDEVSEKEIASRLQQTLERYERRKDQQVHQPNKRQKWQYVAIAASVLLCVGFFGWFLFAEMNDTITYATDFGEWKTVELPDGSIVKLNSNSELTIEKEWTVGADREVNLKGEAFFEVTKKPTTNTKFTVVTSDLAVEVFGTAFNVHARGESTAVFLEEGAINLQYAEKETQMKPGDYLAYSAKKKKVLARKRTLNQENSPDDWKDGTMLFKQEYAFNILKKLEEIYGVRIEVEDEEVYAKRYTIAVPMKDLEIVIPILQRSMQLDIKRYNNTLILK